MFRAICYIDGFNLYYGLKQSGFKRFYWLDLVGFSRAFLPPDHKLSVTKYFTTRVRGGSPKDLPGRARARDESRRRQGLYLDALTSLSDLERFDGHYLQKPFRCPLCRADSLRDEEKMTDVQLATELLVDAFKDRFDTAIVVSADGDLVPPARTIRAEFPKKTLISVFPPGKNCAELRKIVNVSKPIWRTTLSGSQLPDPVILSDGHKIFKPTEWA